MSQLIYEGKKPEPPHEHDLPGTKKSWYNDSRTDINPGALARCSCGKLYVALKSGRDIYWFKAGPILRYKNRHKGKQVQA